MKPFESHSMWTEYGEKIPTSIAIQTTVEDLIDSLYIDDKEFHIHIGKINYIDYRREHIEGYADFTEKNLTDPKDVLELFYAPVMHKRNIYEDEHEVRAVISFESISKNYTNRMFTSDIPFYSYRMFKTDNMYQDDDLTADDMTSIMKVILTDAFHVGVNLGTLIKRIVMSPNANDYFYSPLIKLIKYYGLDRNIVHFSDV